MNILDFKIDLNQLDENQIRLSDALLSKMYATSPQVFDWLDFNNGQVFFEPTLFHIFFDEHSPKTITLEQAVVGYNNGINIPKSIRVGSNYEGMIYLPKMGYIKTDNVSKEIEVSSNSLFTIDKKNKSELELEIPNTPIKIYRHIPDIVVALEKGKLIEPASLTLNSYEGTIKNAVQIMKNNIDDLFHIVEKVTQNLSIFNSNTQNSFAAINQHGTAFINVEDRKQNEVFFIEEIAHQCGHIIFNALTLDSEKYIAMPKTIELRTIIPNSQDKRSIYSAFHGLFTYTCILHSLDRCLDKKIFASQSLLEQDIYARIGFYLDKFISDLLNLNNKSFFTKEGWIFLEEFASGYKKINRKYDAVVKYFDYTNQNYNFDFRKFQLINQFKTI